MREVAGKGCLCIIALIFGLFVGNDFYWVAGLPVWVARVISVVVAAGIAWFLIKPAKSR